MLGVLAVFLLWSQRTDATTASDRLDDYVAAVGAACFLVKAASSAAYREYGRGAHAQDVLARVASTLHTSTSGRLSLIPVSLIRGLQISHIVARALEDPLVASG